MANPIAIALKADSGHKYTDITDISGIGTEGNILPAGAQIGDQVYYDQFDSLSVEVFIDGGGNVTITPDASFTYNYYDNAQQTYGPTQTYPPPVGVPAKRKFSAPGRTTQFTVDGR